MSNKVHSMLEAGRVRRRDEYVESALDYLAKLKGVMPEEQLVEVIAAIQIVKKLRRDEMVNRLDSKRLEAARSES